MIQDRRIYCWEMNRKQLKELDQVCLPKEILENVK